MPAEVSATKAAPSPEFPSTAIVPSVQPDIPPLTNAVRIERLSDDEDVDITDDSSNDGFQVENQSDVPNYDDKEEIHLMSPQTNDQTNPLTQSQTTASDGPTDPDTNEIAAISQNRIDLEQEEESVNSLFMSGSPGNDSLPEEESSDRAGMLSHCCHTKTTEK